MLNLKMTGKELLLHPFINCDQMARHMYPYADNAAALLRDKLQQNNGETFNDNDDEKAIEVFGLLLRAFMQQQGDDASFDTEAFSDN